MHDSDHQDRAYWEIIVEGEGSTCQLAVGVVSSDHELGKPLGDGAAAFFTCILA